MALACCLNSGSPCLRGESGSASSREHFQPLMETRVVPKLGVVTNCVPARVRAFCLYYSSGKPLFSPPEEILNTHWRKAQVSPPTGSLPWSHQVELTERGLSTHSCLGAWPGNPRLAGHRSDTQMSAPHYFQLKGPFSERPSLSRGLRSSLPDPTHGARL